MFLDFNLRLHDHWDDIPDVFVFNHGADWCVPEIGFPADWETPNGQAGVESRNGLYIPEAVESWKNGSKLLDFLSKFLDKAFLIMLQSHENHSVYISIYIVYTL
jgi:hypothetical protein